MKRMTACMIALAGMTALPSCATAVRGTHDKLIVETIPPGARVTTDRRIGKNDDGSAVYASCDATPCTLRIKRRSEFLMTIERDGYAPYEVGITNGLKREALRSNLATSGTVGIAMGVSTAVAVSSIATVSTGGLIGGGAIVAAGTAGTALVGTMLIDGPSGALLNLQPNPVVLELAPEGADVEPHPGALAIREKRAKKAARRAGNAERSEPAAVR